MLVEVLDLLEFTFAIIDHFVNCAQSYNRQLMEFLNLGLHVILGLDVGLQLVSVDSLLETV